MRHCAFKVGYGPHPVLLEFMSCLSLVLQFGTSTVNVFQLLAILFEAGNKGSTTHYGTGKYSQVLHHRDWSRTIRHTRVIVCAVRQSAE